MTRAPFVAPRLLLGGESLLGVSRAPRDRMMALIARYNDANTLAVTLSKALAAGAEGVLVSPSQPLRAALAELKQSVPIYALLPNVPEYVRDSSDLGLVGAALKRVRRASPATLARLGDGVDRAAGKGARASVVFVDATAFVVSVPNRTVITAVDREHMKQQVFTNIDSAVIA